MLVRMLTEGVEHDVNTWIDIYPCRGSGDYCTMSMPELTPCGVGAHLISNNEADKRGKHMRRHSHFLESKSAVTSGDLNSAATYFIVFLSLIM